MGRSHTRSRDRSANGRGRGSHDSHSHDSHKKKKRNKRSRSRGSRRRSPSPSRSTETLSFDAVNINGIPCIRNILAVDSNAVTPNAILQAAFQLEVAAGLGLQHESVVGISSRKLIVTWEFVKPLGKTFDPTKFIITVDKCVGCNINTVAKFQVPLVQFPIDDCNFKPISKTSGASQAFNVQCRPGDLLAVSITQTIEDPCPRDPCDPAPDPLPPIDPASGLEIALVKIILF